MKNKVNTYLIPGILLTYFGLKGSFVVWYNGIALAFAIVAFVYAFVEFRKTKKE